MSAGPGARLAAKLELAAPVYAAAAARLWDGPRLREVYPVYLATMHMLARASAPLLRAARERARELAPDDRLAAALVGLCNFELARRVGFAEALLDDLGETGADRELPLLAIPSPRIASLAGAPYYWIHHQHPVAVLGHLAALDSLSPAPGFSARLQRRSGFPAAAFRCLRARERGQATIVRELDALALTRSHEALLGLAALHAVDAGVEVLAEIHARVFERGGGGHEPRTHPRRGRRA